MRTKRTLGGASLLVGGLIAACSSGGTSSTGPGGAGSATATDASTESGQGDALADASPVEAAPPATEVDISLAVKTPRTATLSVNYWQWSPAYGDDVSGTSAAIAPLGPSYLRIGGYNNDANTPDPFDDAQLDKAIAYARAIGAAPILQVPILADPSGAAPTAATAAAMVQYAVNRGYGVQYYSIGNEPDIDVDQGYLASFTPADYCATASAYVAAMKAVDPTIRIVGPDLAYKYLASDSDSDWLTPILQGCGQLFDVVSIHRYPYSSSGATLVGATRDEPAMRATIDSVRALMQAAGYASTPLALTETNLVYDATTTPLEASPGTVPHALWLADILGAALDEGLWTTAVWDVSDPDGWALGLLGPAPDHAPRPAYQAMALYAAHSGPTLLHAGPAPTDVRVYASRDAKDDATEVIVVNWNTTPQSLAFTITDAPAPQAPPAPAEVTLPPLTMAAVAIPDEGPAQAWIYGQDQLTAATGPAPLAVATTAVVVDSGAEASASAGAFDYTFDPGAATPAFQLDTYVTTPPITGLNPENVAAPGASGDAGAASAIVVATGGDPGGALSLGATFTDYNQIVGASHAYATPQSLAGQTLHVQVKLTADPSFSGQAQLYVVTGADDAGYATSYVPVDTSGWLDLAFALDAPLFANAAYDPTQVTAIGVQLTSDVPLVPADAGPYGPPQPVTLLVDNLHD